jgi:hypothetical protein
MGYRGAQGDDGAEVIRFPVGTMLNPEGNPGIDNHRIQRYGFRHPDPAVREAHPGPVFLCTKCGDDPDICECHGPRGLG